MSGSCIEPNVKGNNTHQTTVGARVPMLGFVCAYTKASRVGAKVSDTIPGIIEEMSG